MSCDLCGKKAPTKLVKLEGVPLRACSDCERYGEAIREVKPRSKPVQKKTDNRVISNNFSELLKAARARSGEKQDEFAKKLGVKYSDYHHWEAGRRTPTLEDAEKLEKTLNIRLTTSSEADEGKASMSSSQAGFTIGDLLKK